jgi:uncharacterized protein YgfB (UPF0149 family)
MSRAGAVGMEPAEIEEDAYVELVEFLRVGVQIVYDEMTVGRRARPGTASRH